MVQVPQHDVQHEGFAGAEAAWEDATATWKQEAGARKANVRAIRDTDRQALTTAQHNTAQHSTAQHSTGDTRHSASSKDTLIDFSETVTNRHREKRKKLKWGNAPTMATTDTFMSGGAWLSTSFSSSSSNVNRVPSASVRMNCRAHTPHTHATHRDTHTDTHATHTRVKAPSLCTAE